MTSSTDVLAFDDITQWRGYLPGFNKLWRRWRGDYIGNEKVGNE